MKKIRLLILAVCAILSMSVAMVAQQADNTPAVRWRTIVKMTGKDSGYVIVRALLGSGWHLYGMELPENGPKPTAFDFAGSAGVQFLDEVKPQREPLTVNDEMFGMTLNWWDANIDFVRHFKVKDANKAVVKCSITYMACNNITCQPPRTENVVARIPKKK